MQGSTPDDGMGSKPSGPHSLMIVGKACGKLPVSDFSGVWQSGVEVSSTRWWSPWVKPRWSFRLGAWNVVSRREDDHLSILSSELMCLYIGIAAL